TQTDRVPDKWRGVLDGLAAVSARTGVPITGQVAVRAVGVLLGWELSWHPFLANPVYRQAVAGLAPPEQYEVLAAPAVRGEILAAAPDVGDGLVHRLATDFERIYLLGDEPDY